MLGPQGRRGEVLAELYTDFPERFAERRRLWGLANDGSRRELKLEEHWFHKGAVVLKFEGVENISEAETLAGIEVQMPSADRAVLEAGTIYVSDLVGCEVWIAAAGGIERLGVVTDVQFGAGEAPLLEVKRQSERREQEYLLPYVGAFLKSVDVPGRRIEMALPEGLLELAAPLSPEERQQQKAEAEEARAAGVSRKKRKP